MRVALVGPTPVPHERGGAERLFDGLQRALATRPDLDVMAFKVPVDDREFGALIAGYEAFSWLDLSHFDVAISMKYPAWMIDHPHHVVYMLHPLRGLYDTYHLFQQPKVDRRQETDLMAIQELIARGITRELLPELFERTRNAIHAHGPDHPAFRFPGPVTRQIVRALDGLALSRSSVERYAAISHSVAARAGYFPHDATVEVVYPPSDLRALREGPYESFFTVSRLDGPKRVELLIDAMAHVPGEVGLNIAGTGPMRADLEQRAATDPRIRFLGFVSDDELVDQYQRALAVPFVPLEEDFGLVALEAAGAAKPVITCIDSGGCAEVVVHMRNGLVTEPDPVSLGAAMTSLVEDRGLAARLGQSARRAASEITWDHLVDRLLGVAAPQVTQPVVREHRRRLVVLSTFPVHPRQGGGQLRAFHLYRGLAAAFDVEILSLADDPSQAGTWPLGPGFWEVCIAKTPAHRAAEDREAMLAGIPVSDVLAPELLWLTPQYRSELRRAITGAAAAVLAHPFLEPELQRAGATCAAVYDAHNAEISLKSSLLGPGRSRQRLLELVERAEGGAWRDAAAVIVCAESDRSTLMARYGHRRGPVVLIPNGADVAGTQFVGGAERRALRAAWLDRSSWLSDQRDLRHVVLFIGSWHPPNIEAAEDIVAAAPELPNALFVLAGGHADAFRGRTLPKNVLLLGVVSATERTELWATADVALNPMRRGSGSNLKLVDYFAAGAPVVTTLVGARESGAARDTHFRLADANGLAPAIAGLLADPAAADAMAVRARHLVEEIADWRQLGQRLLEVVEGAVSVAMPATIPAVFLARTIR